MPDNDEWLAQVNEDIIDPDLPIIDPHHHLWDRNGDTYLLRELHQDTDTGHNIVATVFVECASMYRAKGPAHLSVVGETEFVNGIAAQSASGGYGSMQACAGIVSTADFCMGEAFCQRGAADKNRDVDFGRAEVLRGNDHLLG